MKINLTQILTIALISSALGIGTLGLSGCSSNLATHALGSPTVANAYTSAMRGDTSYSNSSNKNEIDDQDGDYDSFYDNNASNQAVQVSRTSLPSAQDAHLVSHESVSINHMGTLNAQFPTLPNPQSKMYIFGHFAGDSFENEQVPVAGHFVPFSLYTRNYYALPNEVLMPYNDGQFVFFNHPRSQFKCESSNTSNNTFLNQNTFDGRG